MDETWREEAHVRMKKIAGEIATRFGGAADLHVERGYPFLVNDEVVTERAISAAKEYLGEENVEELPLRMTAEDFAFFSQKIPSCFYRLGTANASKGITSGVHTSAFDIDESALQTGAGLLAWLTLSELSAMSS
jgi:metal-dependent amidase/aminoacylase/carboxypeptidase family protein